jgi:hypothetical protein
VVLCAALIVLAVALILLPQPFSLALTSAFEWLGIRRDVGSAAHAAESQLVRPAPVAPSKAPEPELQPEIADTTQTTIAALTVQPALPEGVAPAAPSEPAGLTPAEVARVEEPQLARVRVIVQPPAKVWLDDQPAGDAAPELELSAPAGDHVIGVGDEHGQVQRRDVQLSADKPNEVRFELAQP